jgi:hypothetical protein
MYTCHAAPNPNTLRFHSLTRSLIPDHDTASYYLMDTGQESVTGGGNIISIQDGVANLHGLQSLDGRTISCYGNPARLCFS